ncbi:MAG: HNH endonuclease [Anaerolinea sp.]|nr:HNH endonuclease [Anaerolinea sp.]
MIKILPEIRALVRRRADYRCEYCQTDERLSGIAGEIDHVIPRIAGGTDEPDNLCLACSSCNSHKWAKTEGFDSQTGTVVPLFHPRRQNWRDHFAWSEDGRFIVALTPCGRVTIDVLQMNHDLLLTARATWASFGLHPPR